MESNDLFRLNMGESVLHSYEKEKPSINKQFSKIMKEVRKDAKQEKCFICKNSSASFCNSHSIPKFCLRNISSQDGEVLSNGKLCHIPFSDEKLGINKTGTFHLICRKCDSICFQEYENPDNYLEKPTQKMLAQIAMKNYLKQISKKNLEIQLLETMIKLKPEEQVAEKLDLNEYIEGYNYAKKKIEKNDTGFYMFYYKKLNYVVPIAFQDTIALTYDLNDNLINDIYNVDANYKIKYLHICIFPLKTTSVIIMFIKEGDSVYRNFYKEFNKLKLSDQLQTILFIVLAYSEDIFMSKTLEPIIDSNDDLKNIAQLTTISYGSSIFYNPYEKLKLLFSLNRRFLLPPLLSEEFSLELGESGEKV